MKMKVVPLALASLLAACGGDSSDDLVMISSSDQAQFAAGRISSSTDASVACTTDGPACDAEIDALTTSAFEQMSPYVDGLDMVQLEAAITAAVDYAVQTGGEYPDIDFRYTSPGTSQGAAVTINGGLNADAYASPGSTPVINDEQGVYTDETAPQADPGGDAGWYFLNASAGDKVNWYLYADYGTAANAYTMDDLRALMTTVKLYQSTSDFFFSIYTLPENDGNDASWYRSRVTVASSDFVGITAGTTYTGEFNRDAAVTADLEFTVSGSSVYSTGSSSLADIGGERIMLIAFSTNSGAPVNDIELLLNDFTLTFADAEYTMKPAAASAASDENFEQIVASPAYLSISSGSDLFNGLVFELTGSGSIYEAALVGGGDITLAQRVLLEKLDRGDGYNALVPEAVFDADSGSLVFDFGTALELADLANLTASVYSDAGLTTKEFDITIAADGTTTDRVF